MGNMTARYEDTLQTLLAEPEEAAACLNAALNAGDREVFLLALRDVAEALGMTEGQVSQYSFSMVSAET